MLAVLAVEAMLLVRFGWPPVAALLRLLPGALMLVAVRLALTGAPWWSVALALAASFPFHLADLAISGRPSRGRPDRIN